MTTTQERLDKMISNLMRDRNELRARLHLGKEDLKVEWELLQDKLNSLSD